MNEFLVLNCNLVRLKFWINILFLFFLSLILTGCFYYQYQDESKSSKDTFKVITPDSKFKQNAKVESGIRVTNSFATTIFPFTFTETEHHYTNIIAVDGVKIGGYSKRIKQEEIEKTSFGGFSDVYEKAINYLKKEVVSYNLEISPGLHTLLALHVNYEIMPRHQACYVAELDFIFEEGKKYKIQSGIINKIFIKDIMLNKNTSFKNYINIDKKPTWSEKFVPCDGLEKYRDDFIFRNTKNKQ